MAECEHRIGKVLIRKCGNPATGSCQKCGGARCGDHLTGSLCRSCAEGAPEAEWYLDKSSPALTFTPEEIAAFDEVGDFDRTAGADVYDS